MTVSDQNQKHLLHWGFTVQELDSINMTEIKVANHLLFFSYTQLFC